MEAKSLSGVYANELKVNLDKTLAGEPIHKPEIIMVDQKKSKVEYKSKKVGDEWISTDEVKHIKIVGIDYAVVRALMDANLPYNSHTITVLVDYNDTTKDLANAISSQNVQYVTIKDYYATINQTRGQYKNLVVEVRATTATITRTQQKG